VARCCEVALYGVLEKFEGDIVERSAVEEEKTCRRNVRCDRKRLD
jgi:hypothetical protein